MDFIHVKTPEGSWSNDPNGFIYFKGKYHLFYQHFPFATRWGTMHWGHAVSEDLVHWENVGVALFPTKHFDKDGIFSGSTFELNGQMLTYYTGVHYYASEPDNSHASLNDVYECNQVFIKSEDGFDFDNYDGKKCFLPVIYDDSIGNFNHTRDPKVWEENGQYYMVLGSTYKKETGRLIVLKSDDAENWEVKSVLTDKKFGRILECPDMFKIGDKTIMVISPMYIVPKSEGYEAQSMVGTVDFDPETCEVSNLSEFEFIDHGRDIYATQSCVDEEGRRVLVAWVRMPVEAKNPWNKKPWNGMMCLPRVVEAKEDGIHFSIHPNVRKFFDKELSKDEIKSFKANQKNPWYMETTLHEGESVNIGGYRIFMKNQKVYTNRAKVLPKDTGLKNQFHTPEVGDSCRLQIVAEPNVIEVFVNDGRHVITNAVYDLSEKVSGKDFKIWVSTEE